MLRCGIVWTRPSARLTRNFYCRHTKRQNRVVRMGSLRAEAGSRPGRAIEGRGGFDKVVQTAATSRRAESSFAPTAG